MLCVSHLCHFLVSLVEQLVALADYTLAVYHYKLAHAEREDKLADSTARSASAVYYQSNVAYLFACDLAGVHQRRCNDYRRSVLVIVENRDIKPFLELCLYLEASRCSDVLKVDTSEAVADKRDGINYLVNVI